VPFETVGSLALWMAFIGFVVVVLALDLGVFHRKAHEVGPREAAIWSAVWIALAGAFNLVIYAWFGSERALEFAAGYLLEKALALDNVFVFVVIFSTFAIPRAYQHRVLFWGIFGAFLLRGVFILAGGVFLHHVHGAIYVFGAILAATGIKLLLQRNEEPHPERNPIVRALGKIIPILPGFHGEAFTVVRDGRRYATSLLLALIAVEVSDVVFAVDSIPAIFAITQDPFIVLTSNVFAILGLRSLYFLLAAFVTKFVHLKTGLALVILFVGAKMLLLDVFELPVAVSLVVIAGILGVSIAWSVLRPPPDVPLPAVALVPAVERRPSLAETCRRIVDASWFQRSVLALIVVNAIVMGLETWPSALSRWERGLSAVSLAIQAAFVVEIALRITAHGRRPLGFLRSGWNVFDFTVVGLSLLPAAGSLATIARLARVLRTGRLVTRVPELRLIIGTMLRSIPSMGHVVLLLGLLVYIYGVIGHHLFGTVDPLHWGDLGRAAHTLFVIITLEGWVEIMRASAAATPLAWLYYASFIVVAVFVVINLFIAVVINNFETVRREDSADAGAEKDLRTEVRALRREVAELGRTLRSEGSSRRVSGSLD